MNPDVLIIGAGPGGSLAAIILARAEYSVTLVDRASFPRPKVCGGCLSPRACELLASLDLSNATPDATTIDTLCLRTSGAASHIPANGYRAISREVFDHRLMLAAQSAGASVLTNSAARVQPDHSVLIESQEITTTLTPRFTLIADGLSGTSLSALSEFSWKVSRSSRMGIGAILSRPPIPLSSSEISMTCHRHGYIGMVRLPSGDIDLAAAVCPRALRHAGGPAELCDTILHATFKDSSPLTPQNSLFRGTPRLTRTRSRIESGNILLIGDSAGYIEPFTGEGMTWSMQSAVAAASLLCHALDSSSLSPGQWSATHRALLSSQHRRCRLISTLIRHNSLLAGTLHIMNQFPELSQFASNLINPPRIQSTT